jgi:hypothetical protein
MANGFTEAARLAQPGQVGHVVSGIARFITLTEKYMREQAMDDIISGDGSPLAAAVDGANLGVVPGNVLMPLEERHYQILLRVLSTCNAKTVELKNRIRIIEMVMASCSLVVSYLLVIIFFSLSSLSPLFLTLSPCLPPSLSPPLSLTGPDALDAHGEC